MPLTTCNPQEKSVFFDQNIYFFIWTNSAKQADNKKLNSCCGDDSLTHSVLWSMNRIWYNCVDDAFQMWQIKWINRNDISGIHWQIFNIATAATFLMIRKDHSDLCYKNISKHKMMCFMIQGF